MRKKEEDISVMAKRVRHAEESPAADCQERFENRAAPKTFKHRPIERSLEQFEAENFISRSRFLIIGLIRKQVHVAH